MKNYTFIVSNKRDTPRSWWQTITHPFDDVVHQNTNSHSRQNGLCVQGQLQHGFYFCVCYSTRETTPFSMKFIHFCMKDLSWKIITDLALKVIFNKIKTFNISQHLNYDVLQQ